MIGLAFLFYYTITAFVILYVGRELFVQGKYYLLELFQPNARLSNQINKTLLAGYYLLNLGYLTWSLSTMPAFESPLKILDALSGRIGFIVLALGIIHFINIALLRTLKNYLN